MREWAAEKISSDLVVFKVVIVAKTRSLSFIEIQKKGQRRRVSKKPKKRLWKAVFFIVAGQHPFLFRRVKECSELKEGVA